MAVIKTNPKVVEKIYQSVTKFIEGKVRVIDALSGLILVIVSQAKMKKIPKQLILDKISEAWDLMELEEEAESDKCQ